MSGVPANKKARLGRRAFATSDESTDPFRSVILGERPSVMGSSQIITYEQFLPRLLQLYSSSAGARTLVRV
jgi:hypothetical protein